ncbi:MAG: PA4780 family RIO1-like protein kinase [Marinomonas foliarum]|jgi:RIO kinase 1|uniref:non-specific serine/threonine protein kinase n=1 Tax=Marinomonas foliarum TaxID=491950 RepID=A0A368ZTA1_9GAMM|nr:PA4780 family RIO1-like protein kinase [Marinomonas foliarum]QRV22438.1 serine protein kinase RIO [Marinomonas foliarum]RCW96456.1 RIO kinase 1 [Marinomonas foliarum]
MKIPKRIQPLIEDGLVDEVLRQLMSGKEATVYVVRCGSEIRCAKVYKEAGKRSFKQAVQYREGRKVRNSRRSRAMEKGSKFGRDEQENLWQNAEVDALYRLAAAGVRAPTPYGCFDGVLLMELVTDDSGDVAPRLNDVVLTAEQAKRDHDTIIKDIVRMLSAGLIHGDLSEFNVLVDSHGPVIIDLPQAVDAVANNNAEWMLERDVNNMRNYYGMFAPELLETKYAKEMWALFEAGKLTAHTELTGHFEEPTEEADVDSVLQEIQDAFEEEQDRLARINSSEDED